MENVAFNEQKIRVFRRDGQEFAGVRVNVILGNGRSYSCEIDQTTGLIDLPPGASWEGINTEQDVKARENDLARQLYMIVLIPEGAPVVVTQRKGHTNRYDEGNAIFATGYTEYHLPICGISRASKKGGGLRVWVDPMNKEGGNRADLWSVFDRSVELDVIYATTLTDMKTLSVVKQPRWQGDVYLRDPKRPYKLPKDADGRARTLYKNPKVKAFLDKYVIVPGEHCEDFSSRMQIVLNPKFRDLVDGLTDLEIWDDDENFWVKRKHPLRMGPGKGSIEFFTYGVGQGSYGIIHLDVPIEMEGYVMDSLQFDHFAVDPDIATPDVQGIYEFHPATLVQWDDVQFMGTKSRRNDEEDPEPWPPKVYNVWPLTKPYGLEPPKAA